MPKKRHSPEQIIGKLRDADAMLAAGKTIGYPRTPQRACTVPAARQLGLSPRA